MEIRYVERIDRVYVNKRGLDLSKEVLWVSGGQRAAKLPTVKVGGKKKNLPIGPARVRTPGTLTAHSSTSL